MQRSIGDLTPLQSDAVLFDGNDNEDRKKRFNLGHWINPDRAELFFARHVVFVEGSTEKVILSYLAEKLGIFDVGVSIIDCGSKFNLGVYIELAGSFKISYSVVHDEDPVKEGLEGDKLKAAQRTYAVNQELEEISLRTDGTIEVLSPDFESLFGISKTQGKKKGKPLASIDHFEELGVDQYPQEAIKLVNRLYVQ